MKPISLVAFVIKARLKNRFAQNPIAVLWPCIATVVAVGQGMGAVYLLGMIIDGGHFESSALIGVINLTVVVLILISNFFPTYRPTSAPICSFHPIERWNRGLFSALCDVATLRIALVTVFYFVLLLSPAYSVSDLALSLITALTAIMIERSLRLLLDYSFSRRLVHAITNIMIMTILGGSLTMGLRQHTGHEPLTAIGLFSIALIHHVILSYVTAGVPSSSHRSAKGHSLRSLRSGRAMSGRLAFVYLRTPFVLSALGTGFFFKMLALFLLSLVIKSGGLPFDPHFLFYLVAAPITPFNSVLNNAFGHGVSFWDTVRLHTDGVKQNVLLFTQLCFFPCVMDVLISCVAAFVTGLLNYRFALFYAGVLLSLISIGYCSSLVCPRPIKSLPSFANPRSNTSPLISFALTIPVAAVFAASIESPFLFVLVGAAVITSLATALTVQTNYRNLAQRTHVILHS